MSNCSKVNAVDRILLMIRKHNDGNEIPSPEGAEENSRGRDPGVGGGR